MDTIRADSKRPKPRYRQIADSLAARITDGELEAGARLPTHRDLADELGVTVGTVTRAYAELERAGLARGEVGRGTFVRARTLDDFMIGAEDEEKGVLDLSRSYPSPRGQARELSAALEALAQDRTLGRLVGYQMHAGRKAHRAAGAEWLRRGGLEVEAERVILTAGAQHGLLAALAAALKPGDRLGVEEMCFPGTKSVARMFGCRLEPLSMDDEGIHPEAVESALRGGVRVISCVSTLNNPTCSIMSIERRKSIAALLQEHDALLVEDDIFGRMLPEPLPPIASFAPGNALYLTSLSKTVAPGLRIGYLVVPPDLFDAACAAVRASSWMATPLMAEIATRWIEEGSADAILERQRAEARSRMELAEEILGAWDATGVEGAFHLWFRVPEPWTAASLVAAARLRGVQLATASPFVVGGGEPQALRICLGTPARRGDLESGLRTLAEILAKQSGSADELSIV